MFEFQPRMRWPCAFVVLLCLGFVAQLGFAQPVQPDTVATVMGDATARVDRDMMAAATGDADHDFAAMMIPHHRGAVEMAEVELRFGHNPILSRLAQAIIVERRQEIDIMQRSLAAVRPASVAPLNENDALT